MTFRRYNLPVLMQMGGVDDRLTRSDRPTPFPTRDLIVDMRVALEGKGDEAIMYPDRWVGDTPPYADRVTGTREPEWGSRKIPWQETRQILGRFERLAEAPNEKYLIFANRWGLLGLCDRHGLPFTHPDNEDCLPTLREPVKHWRNLARVTRAILRIATDLQWTAQYPSKPRKLGSEIDWRSLDKEVLPELIMPKDLDDARGWLSHYVNLFVDWTQIQPQFVWGWDEQQPSIRLIGWSTFSYIAAQLIFFVAQGKDLALCTFCGTPYGPIRLPRPGQRNFCEACSESGIPQRLAKRDWRARRSKPRKKRDSG